MGYASSFQMATEDLPSEGKKCPVSFHTEPIDHGMDTHLLGSHVEEDIPEANGLRNAVLYSCEECGMVTDTNGLCHFCAPYFIDNLESTSNPENNSRMYSPIAWESPSWVAGKWIPTRYQSQGTTIGDMVHSQCVSCGAAILPDEGSCFSCISNSSKLPDYTKWNSSYESPTPVDEGTFPKCNSSAFTQTDEDLMNSQSLSMTFCSDWGLDIVDDVLAGLGENDAVGRDYHFACGNQELFHTCDSASESAPHLNNITNFSMPAVFPQAVSLSNESKSQPVYDSCQQAITSTEKHGTHNKELALYPSTNSRKKASICVQCRLAHEAVRPFASVLHDIC